MKRVIAIAIGVLGLLAAAIGVSNADPGTHNDHGLCTAYFNGQKVGHGPGEDTDDPPPFEELQTTSETYTDNDSENDFPGADNDEDGDRDDGEESEDLTDAENIFNYCNDYDLIGGNPEHGRFECVDEGTVANNDSPDTESNPECDRRDKPGNG